MACLTYFHPQYKVLFIPLCNLSNNFMKISLRFLKRKTMDPQSLGTNGLRVNTINPYHVSGLFLYSLKTSENYRFSEVFREYRKRPVICNELSLLSFKTYLRSLKSVWKAVLDFFEVKILFFNFFQLKWSKTAQNTKYLWSKILNVYRSW